MRSHRRDSFSGSPEPPRAGDDCVPLSRLPLPKSPLAVHSRRMLDLANIGGMALAGLETHDAYLVFDLAGELHDAAAQAVVRWLSSLACPAIGVGQSAAHPSVQSACDVVVTDEDTAAELGECIAAAPKAAMVLVHLLRISAGAPIADALTMESLAYGLLQAGSEHRAWLNRHRTGPRGSGEHNAADPIRVERQDDVLKIVLDRPRQRNAVSAPMRDALCEALSLVVLDTSIERVDITGAGACFSIGGDLEEFGGITDPVTAHGIRMARLPARFLAACAERAQVRVHSACIGAGVELAAFAKRVIAAESAFFQLPELKMGIIPGAGGCVSIPRRIGRQRAAFMAISGRRINARTALKWGLVDAIDPTFTGG
jgi:enoyl-CoA hydratase